MEIKDVELVNDYMLSLKRNVFKSIKSNKSLFGILSKEERIESEDDILPSDLIEACEGLNIDFKAYVEEFDIIRITMEDNSIINITNLEIGAIWDWHDYCEEMICNWLENYLTLTATDVKGEEGIMAIYDISKKGWIFYEPAPYMRGMIYAPEADRFIGLYDIPVYGQDEYGIVIMDPQKDFTRDKINFETHGEAYENGEQKTINTTNYGYDAIQSQIDKDEVIGCEIDEDTMLLWNGEEKCVYVKMKNKGYRYCIGEKMCELSSRDRTAMEV